MQRHNNVVFKGNKDSIVILLNDAASFEEIKRDLTIKVYDARDFFSKSKSAISFEGKDLTDSEEKELIDIVAENIDISFIKNKIIKEQKDRNIYELVNNALVPNENSTVFHKGSLRSGQSIKYAGSVVFIGDINSGAEIVADGNIIVLGNIKGLLHAGASGNYDCFIAGLNILPVQLRVADIITYVPDNFFKSKNINPFHAYIQNSQIYISHLA